jgi:hypothetical protein
LARSLVNTWECPKAGSSTGYTLNLEMPPCILMK